MDLATRGRTSNRMIQDMNTSKMLNRALGTDLGPWDVEEIPQEWIQLIINLNSGQSGIQKAQAEKKRITDQVVANHPTYRPNKK